MLTLRDVEIHRGRRAVLKAGNVEARSPGALCIVGPGGAGKSSLLTALAGLTLPSLEFRGIATLDGRQLFDHSRVFVGQHFGRFAAEPMHVASVDAANEAFASPRGSSESSLPNVAAKRFRAVLDELERSADVYFVDEPTVGLDDRSASAIRTKLASIAQRATLILVTHDRADCLAVGGTTLLLAGGAIQECAPTAQFFSKPRTGAGRMYVDTGSCHLASPMDGGLGIFWLASGLLSGMSRPGLVADVDEQMQHLIEGGSGLVICLEEKCEYDRDRIREHGLEFHHVPIRDMRPPTFDQALHICRLAEFAIRAGRGVTVHCRGGLGRTGAALAAILVWFGDAPDVAISRVRKAQRLALQTSEQVRFIGDFADRISSWHTHNPRRDNHVA